MARNDTRRPRAQSPDRVHLRAGADSWHSLATTTVVAMGLVPALIVGALFLIEALFVTPASQTAQLPLPLAGSHNVHVADRLAARLALLCAQRNPAACATK